MIPVLNVHIYPSYLTNESRILKEAASIIRATRIERVVILGFWRKGLERREVVHPGVEIVRLGSLQKAGRYKILNFFPFVAFYFLAWVYCIRNPVRVVNCHSLTVLPLCVAVKLSKGSKLVYDPHELETETNESRGLRKRIAKLIEWLFFRFSDHTVVVSDSINHWYLNAYRLKKISTIKNIPSQEQLIGTPVELKKMLGIPESTLLFIYQGLLSESRGVHDILSVFEDCSQDRHIVFMGDGPLKDQVAESTRKFKTIHLLPLVSPSEVLRYSAGADVGIHIIPNTCLNHYYCLPNKVFEYLLAGVPFIVSEFPDISNEFSKYDVAWFVQPGKEDLRSMVESLTPPLVSSRKQNVLASRANWKWENQDSIFQSIFAELA